MDHSYPYIASLTREPFLFYEMRSTAKLMAEGNSNDAIVKEIVEQNLFQYPTEKSITRMAKACIKRLHALEDDSLVSAIASQPNLKFIADALGGKGQPKDVIRDYFLNGFYTDHCSKYSVTGSGKRPIYWLLDSGKKNGFKALIYMHRYQPDTIARIRTDYVHEQQARYRTAIADLEQRIANASTGERVKLKKKLTTLQAQDTEIRTYEEKIHHLADQMISIDLDDGVKKNYAIFQDVLAKIK